MRSLKTSFIVTVYNEQKTIETFLRSLILQTKLPDEVVIVDGGSTDKTIYFINKIIKQNKNKLKIRLIEKRGNRSVGRNEAIKNTKGDIILCSDAGNILDKNWIKEIIKPFNDTRIDVVAGYYNGKATNLFQKCLIPYVLVMEDKLKPNDFLPATRSIAFKKSIWKKVGGFDESFSHNEDYVFANKLKENGAKIYFAKNAIVNWIPRDTYRDAFVMFFRFAFGDAESSILRFKVFLLFARYFLALYLSGLSLLYNNLIGIYLVLLFFISYLIYIPHKHYKYVKKVKGIPILISLQFIADIAVLSGTLLGFISKIRRINYKRILASNIFLLFIIAIYGFIMSLSINYGIPDQHHPFPYNMDEWHQLQAVRATAKFGTPNIAGSANGTMFYFLSSVVYLAPFTLIDYINPAVLKINDLLMRERIFELLRINTILYGVMCIIVFDRIIKRLALSRKYGIILFTATPIWLFVSGYFKYDIALLFLTLLTTYFLIKFSQKPKAETFIYAAIAGGLSFSIKVSAIPLLPILIIAFMLFYSKWYKNIHILFAGIITYLLTILFFGTPDTLFGKGNFLFYFYENVILSPTLADNLNLGMNQHTFIYTQQFPLIYGYGFILLFLFSIIVLGLSLTNLKQNILLTKQAIFILLAFILLLLSLFPLKLYGGGNRSIVLLPFAILIILFAYSFVSKKILFNFFIKTVILVVILLQILQSSIWLTTKLAKSPQQVSSEWVTKNIQQGTTIGLEPMPLYQGVPEFIEKEYYYTQYKIPFDAKYKYSIIDKNTKVLPKVVIVTNGEIDAKIYNKSDTKDLMKRLKDEKYIKKVSFSPDFTYFKYIGNDLTYYLSYLTSTPIAISVYTLHK